MMTGDQRGAMALETTSKEQLVEKLRLRLQASEERFRSIIDKSADTTLIVDLEGIIRFANPACAFLFRRSPRALVGEFFGYPIAGGKTTEIEVICKDQPSAIAEMHVVETEWEGAPALLATLRDITRRKRLEQDLQEALTESENARNHIDTIIRSVAEGLIVTDNEHRILLMNPAAEVLLGAACRELLHQPIAELFRDPEVNLKFLANLAGNPGERFDFELTGQDPKHPIHIQARSSPISDKSGHKLGLITILQDVTHEREVERMKSEFVSLAAHELRSPLTSIVGFSEVLLTKSDMPPEEQRRCIEVIKEQGYALADIVDSFLDISRIEAGHPLPLNKCLCTAAELIQKAEPFIRVNQDNYQFDLDLVEEDTYLLIDRKRMGQVLENLLSNAVKYSPAGTPLKIAGRPMGSAYRFSVQDQGIGMTADQVERIFDKFYRADTSDNAVSGIGLGMSIVKYIVEAHGGKIGVESSFGQGTTVWFAVPAELSN